MKAFCFICTVFFSLFGVADSGWVSSGGELFRFDKNPWFVKNTSRVNYCVVFDQSSMSIAEDVAKQSILEAIDFWNDEFKRAHYPAQGFAKLGGQEFVYQSQCNEKTDIAFKFGISALSVDPQNNERAYLKNPKKYIGVSVRTSGYEGENRRLMKASGFIYISSDIGPSAYENKGHLIERAWEQPNLLKYALVHELGHVFGIPHNGSGLMSEVFMDQLVHKRFSKHFVRGDLQSYLHPPKELKSCGVFGMFNAHYFGIPSDASCLILNEVKPLQYKVSYALKKDSVPIEIGSLRFVSTTLKDMAARPCTLIHLPDEQEVYSVKESFLNTYMIGPLFTDLGGKAVFNKVGSFKPYHLYMEVKPESLTLVADVNNPPSSTGGVSQAGKPEPVFVYVEPLMLKLQLPL